MTDNKKFKSTIKNDNIQFKMNYVDPFDSTYLKDIQEFLKLYDTTKDDVLSDPKMEFRYFCFRYLDNIREIELHELKKGSKYESVIIEFRNFPHIEFIIRNAILRLGIEWSHTVICGTDNYEFIVNMCNHISPNIKIIKTEFHNLNTSRYSLFLASHSFWNQLYGEKILIYQEDSIIFKNNINDFLEWDYVGAPWVIEQNDNPLGVGNGGLSLRTKKCMIDVIKNKDILDTEFNSSTLDYMKNSKMSVGPEDVYFTLNMINLNLGRVADRETASKFSTERIYNPDSFGGHNFWLSDPNWRERLFHIFHIRSAFCLITSPYGLNIGGGEVNLLNFAKYFIDKKNCMIYLCITDRDDIKRNTIQTVLGHEYLKYFIMDEYAYYQKYQNKVDYHFDMYNSKIPQVVGCAIQRENNFFHCQFPFDTDRNIEKNHPLISYKNIILNSEFTKKYYNHYTKKYYTDQNIYIVYPLCYNQLNNEIYEKEENSFVMIGRIFDYMPKANNKNFDIALKFFEKISYACNNFKVYIVGTNYSDKMLNRLKSYRIHNIEFCINIDNETKFNILKKAKYILNLVGANRDLDKESYAYEHFGISIIEGIHYGCIPITINGGFPSYYINNENGFVINNEKELEKCLIDIILGKCVKSYKRELFQDILEKCSLDYFYNTMDNITNNQ